MLPRFWLKRLQQLSFFDTFKHASTYFSGTLVVHLLGIITLPIYTAYLSTAEYGITNVFLSYVPIVAAVASFNLYGTGGRYYFEKDKTDYPEFMGSLFLGMGAGFLGFGILWWLLTPWLAEWMNLSPHLLKWMFGMAIMAALMNTYTQVMVSIEESKRYSIVQVIWQYGKLGCAVVCMLFLVGKLYLVKGEWESYTYMGKIIGEFWWTFVILLYAMWSIRSYISFKKPSWDHLRYAFHYSLPLLPMGISGYLLNSFDQWFIIKSVGAEEAGQYAFAYKIGLLYMGLISALLNGANQRYYNLMNAGELQQINQQVVSICKLLVLGACLLVFFAIDIGTLLSSDVEFLTALPIAPVIVLGYVFYGIATFVVRGIYYVKKNSYLAGIMIFVSVLNVLLNLWFIPRYGYQAAAYTTMASYFVMLIVAVYITTVVLKLSPPPLGQILKYLVLLALVIALYYWLGKPFVGLDWGSMAFKSVLLALFAGLLFYNQIKLLRKTSDTDESDVQ